MVPPFPFVPPDHSFPCTPPRARIYASPEAVLQPNSISGYSLTNGHESDTSFEPSSPIRGSKIEKARARRIKGQRRRRATLAASYADKRDLQAWRNEESQHDNLDLLTTLQTTPQNPTPEGSPEPNRSQVFEDVMEQLRGAGLTWGDLVEWVSNPSSSCPAANRYEGFFRKEEQVVSVLNHWCSWRNCNTGRKLLRKWVLEYVCQEVSQEGDAITKSDILQSRTMTVDKSFILDFDLSTLYDQLYTLSPMGTTLLHALCTTPRQKASMNDNMKLRKQLRIGTSLLILLGERSQQNSYFKHIIATYLYASGASRQVLGVAARLGLSSSYTTLTASTAVEPSGSGKAGAKPTQTATGENLEDIEKPEGPMKTPSEEVKANMDNASQSDSNASSGLESDSDDRDVTRSEESELEEPLRNVVQRKKASVESKSDTNAGANPSTTVTTLASPNSTSTSLTTARKRHQHTGLLYRLSLACRDDTRRAAKTSPVVHIYDNINWVKKIAEQILGRSQAQENGTCATIIPLFKAQRSEMKFQLLLDSISEAGPLTLDDVILTTHEQALHRKCIVHTVLRILLKFGGENFVRFKKDIDSCLPTSSDQIALHKTDIHPLPTMNINESSITGNAEVMETIFKELGQGVDKPEFMEEIRVVCGDQLSVTNLRSVTSSRVGHDSPPQTLANVVTVPGLFHAQIHIVAGTLETHWGSAEGPQDPGSLHFHNTLLARKPIVLSSLPPYRTCRDLIFVSLYARVLRCLELITGCNSLDVYSKTVTFDQLYTDVSELVERYATAQVAMKLRSARTMEFQRPASERTPQGDVVFENAVLFMRDALLVREFTDAIKAGDSGRIVVCLKTFALSYRGCGRTKYAYEMLHIIHNLAHVWPEPLRQIVLNNWLANTTGWADSFLPLDLLQEHMNFWIKTIYNANGSNASWEWLENISPCVDVLRQLATHMNNTLGSKLGQKHHAPDLTKDIHKLLGSLRDKAVYEVHPGRTVERNGTTSEVTNLVAAGLHALPGPLRDYNERFSRLREQYREKPLIGTALLSPSPLHGNTHSKSPISGTTRTQDECRSLITSEDDENDIEELQLWGGVEDIPDTISFTLEDEEDLTLDME